MEKNLEVKKPYEKPVVEVIELDEMPKLLAQSGGDDRRYSPSYYHGGFN